MGEPNVPKDWRDEYDERWAERDRRREFNEKVNRDRAAAERDRLGRVVEAALSDYDCVGGMPWDEVADIAIAALVADGVIFAYLAPDEASATGGAGS